MLTKCSLCKVGYFTSKIINSHFICDNCLGDKHYKSNSLSYISQDILIEKLKKEVSEKDKLITMLLDKQKKTTVLLNNLTTKESSLKLHKEVTDVEEIKEEEKKQYVYNPDPSISLQAILVYVALSFCFIIYFLKNEIRSLL